MKAVAMVLVVIILIVNSMAIAVVDPHPNQIGVYFDSNANINSLYVSPMEPFDVYVIVTRPSGEIDGFVFGYRLEIPSGQEGSLFRLGVVWPGGPSTECFNNECGGADMFEDYYTFGLPVPLPASVAVTILRWQFLLFNVIPIDFYITPAYSPEFGFETPSYFSGLDLIPLGISSGAVDLPVARVNGMAPVPLQGVTFGAVKALFR